MEIQEILERLDRHYGSFPNELVAEIILRREEAIPLFLAILQDIDSDPAPWLVDDDHMVHIYAMYFLALFRDVRAYPVLVRIFSHSGEFPFDLAGEVTTQDLGPILVSVSGGDARGIKELIENEQANEYVRAVAMGAMVSLVATGQCTRDEAVSYFLELFHKLERVPGVQWDGLATAFADLWPREAMDELRRAYNDGLMDPRCIGWDDIERALWLGKERAMRPRGYREPLITDLAKDMKWMQCFHKKERYVSPGVPNVGSADDRWEPFPDDPVDAQLRRTTPKVGRNETCPCGSGKKYKKCCGAH